MSFHTFTSTKLTVVKMRRLINKGTFDKSILTSYEYIHNTATTQIFPTSKS